MKITHDNNGLLFSHCPIRTIPAGAIISILFSPPLIDINLKIPSRYLRIKSDPSYQPTILHFPSNIWYSCWEDKGRYTSRYQRRNSRKLGRRFDRRYPASPQALEVNDDDTDQTDFLMADGFIWSMRPNLIKHRANHSHGSRHIELIDQSINATIRFDYNASDPLTVPYRQGTTQILIIHHAKWIDAFMEKDGRRTQWQYAKMGWLYRQGFSILRRDTWAMSSTKTIYLEGLKDSVLPGVDHIDMWLIRRSRANPTLAWSGQSTIYPIHRSTPIG